VNRTGSKRAGTSRKEEIPTSSDDSGTDNDGTGTRRHQAQKKAAQKNRRAVKAREAKTLSTIPDGDVKEGMKKLEVLAEVPGSAAMRFAAKKPQGMDTFWALAGEDTWEEATEVALEPKFSEGAVYLAILGDRHTVSVLHSLCRLKTPLRAKNPVIGKVAAFVGEVRPKDFTPNMVYFDEDTDLATRKTHVVKFDTVFNYINRHKRSPKADEMVDEGDVHMREVSPLMPVPSEWALFFLDNPSILTAMERVKALMKTLNGSELRRYLPLAENLAVAARRDNNESILSINGAHMLAYAQPVKRCAEALWERDMTQV
jgi:hypothetical protein